MNRETNRFNKAIIVLASVLGLILSPIASAVRAQEAETAKPAESKTLASLDFDPKVNGFGFENFTNEGHDWKKDLGTEDLIRMFGAKSVCKSGSTAANCVVNASARQWLDQTLDAMNGGHCEGMAVVCLRMDLGLPFKGKVGPGDFQSGIKMPFDLKLDHPMLNYISYYWATQELWEPSKFTEDNMAKGPVAVVKILIDAMNTGSDTYTLGFFNVKNGKFVGGHAITPFAVEDAGTFYKILVYDNNFPGETRVVTVEKGGKQTWKYVTSTNPQEAADNYVGDINTKSIGVTPTSLREGRCFDAPFSELANTESGCGKETVPQRMPVGPVAKPDAPKPSTPPVTPPTRPATKFVELSLTGEGDMLVVDGNNRKIGYDPELDKDFDEIPGSQMDTIIGGLGIDMPHYRLPYDPKGKPLTVIFSGADLMKESTMDFVYSGPGFTVGFDDIRLDPGEVLVAVISQNGEKLGMALSNDGVMPEIYYAVDTPKKSYMAEIKRNGAVAGKAATGSTDLKKIRAEIGGSTIFGAMRQIKFDPKTEPPVFAVNFDDGAGKLQIMDNSVGDSSYDVDLEQFDATGKTDKIQLNDVGANDGGANDYEIEVGEWNGGSKIEVKHDAAGDGFDNDPEVEQDNAPNNITDDPDKNTAGLFIKFIENSLTW